MDKKTKVEKPAHKLAGTAIALMDCPDCGAEKQIRVNRNGNAYFDCREIVDLESGERCYCSRKWGRVRSAEMIKDFEEAQRGEAAENGQQDGGREEITAQGNGEEISAANDNAESPANDNDRGEDSGAFNGFFC